MDVERRAAVALGAALRAADALGAAALRVAALGAVVLRVVAFLAVALEALLVLLPVDREALFVVVALLVGMVLDPQKGVVFQHSSNGNILDATAMPQAVTHACF